ncbi:MAG: hypothetical protein LR008_01385 [Candidatus Pacebacteria bacterium]|nr:hypothetical protein [Candidatus Paceibacterota bacterium]
MTHTHHATLVRANPVTTCTLSDLGANCEVRDTYIPKFGINDARELVRVSYQRPADATEQVLVVRTDFITLESQNALLKLLEEPPKSTRLIFVLPPDFIVIPTLASRINEQSVESSEPSENLIFAEFLKAGYKDRISSIDKAAKQKDVDWQRAMKLGLIQYLSQPALKVLPQTELDYVARTLLTRGASNKMLLEQVALTLPVRS